MATIERRYAVRLTHQAYGLPYRHVHDPRAIPSAG